MRHVVEFIQDEQHPAYVRLALGCLLQHRNWFNTTGFALFCTYNGRQHRVVGAHLDGHIALTDDLDLSAELPTPKVLTDVDQCSNWEA